MESVLSPYAQALEGHRPFLVAARPLRERLPRQPLGLSVPSELCVDPVRSDAGPLFARLQALDHLLFGRLNLEMPRWALYDCAALPGLICGFACAAGDLPDRTRAALCADDPLEPVPVSMLLAVPTLDPACWLIYSLGGLHDVFPSLSSPSLRHLTVALGLTALGAERALVVTQWASPRLAVYAGFGPLSVRAAYLPAYDVPASCVCEMDARPAVVTRALHVTDPPELAHDVRYVDAGDAEALEALQREIEAGARVRIVAQPRYRGGRLSVPLEVAG